MKTPFFIEKLFLEQSNDLIWIISPDFILMYANKAYLSLMLEITGVKLEINEPIFTKEFGDGDIKKWKAYYERALKEETFNVLEHLLHPETNEVRICNITFKPIYGDDSSLIAIACQSKDVTNLDKQEKHARHLLSAALDVYCIINRTGEFVYVSDAAKSHWGFDPEELIGKYFKDFVIADDIHKTNEIFERILQGLENKTFVNRFRKSNGDIAYNQWSSKWDDETQLMYCVARDIKVQFEQEEIIRQSEERFKALVQEGSDLISIFDSKGNYIYASPSSLSFLSMPPDTIIGKSVFDFIHPEDADEAYASLEKIQYQKKVIVKPFRFRNQENQWSWFETILLDMREHPFIKGIVANSRDITANIEEEYRLKLFESVITNTNDAVLITEAEPFDEPGPKIIFANEAFTKMTGYTSKEIIGKTPRILQGPNSDQDELARLSHAIRKREPCEVTILNYKKNGEEFWVNFTVTPVANDTGRYTHIISIQRDATDQMNKEFQNQLYSNINIIFNNEHNFEKATDQLCEAISVFGKFELVELWKPNIEKTQIRLQSNFILKNEDSRFYDYSQNHESYNIADGLAGKVFSTGEQIFINNLDKNNFKRVVAANKIGLKSFLGIPLISNEEKIGVLIIGSKRNHQYLKKFKTIFTELEGLIGAEINRKTLENDLNRLLYSIPELVSTGDFQGKFLQINSAGCQMLGYSEEEILFNSFENFIHPDDRELAMKELRKLELGEIIVDFEIRFIQKSGDIVWLSWNCKPNFKQEVIYSTAKNVTEEKRLRELNREAREIARLGSWELDFVNNTLYWSDMVHNLHETDPNEYKPKLEDAIQFFRKDFQELVKKNIDESIHNNTVSDFEAVIVTANNKELWVRAQGKAEFINGICTRFYGSLQDINFRKQAETRLHALAENLPGVVFQYVVDSDGKDSLDYVTNGVNEIWGFTAKEVIENIQLVWDRIILGGDFEKVQNDIALSIKNKTKWKSQWKYVMPNGDIKTHLGYGSPQFHVDGSVSFNSIILDVTQQVKNEELLEEVSELAKIGSWEMDFDSQTLYWSDQVHKIYDTNPAEFTPNIELGINLFRSDFQSFVRKKINSAIATGESYNFEAVIVTAQKKEIWVYVIGNPVIVDGECLRIYGSYQDINESKVLEIRLSEILSSISDAFYTLDKDWKFTYLNKEAELLFNYGYKEIIGKEIWDVIPAANNIQLNEVYQRVVKNKKSESIEYFYQSNKSWYKVNVYPFAGGVSVYFINIDERIEAAQKLRDSFEEKNQILESIGDAFFAVNNDWTVTYWNKEAEKILGKSRDQIVGKNLWDEYPETVDTEFYSQYHKSLRNSTSVRFETYYHELKKWFDISAYPASNGLSVYFKDITFKKEAEQELEIANERFEKVTQATNDAIWDWDIENDTFYRSDAIERFFGIDTSKKLSQRNFWKDKFHPGDLNKIKESINKTILDTTCNRWEEQYRILNEESQILHINDRGIVIRDNEGKAIRMIGAMTDITEQKKLTLQLNELNQSLKEYAVNLERTNVELEQFAFIASHDLQEPLRMISSFMNLLKHKYEGLLDDKAHQYINFATEGASRMKKIIHDLLIYSRGGMDLEDKEDVNIEEILNEYKLLRRKIISEKSALIQFDGLPTLRTFKSPIVQIFHCILDNALNYSKENTSPIIKISAIENKDYWEFSIKDNGIGIDPDFFGKIFIIFQRLQNNKSDSGTGVGLAIAKKLVEQLGGRIWVTSVPGSGSIFYFTLAKN